MYRDLKATAIAVLLLILSGLLLNFGPWGFSLERDFGLDMLFHLRGSRPAPRQAVIVSIDQESEMKLDLPFNVSRWPRRVYADLIENLLSRGAAVIAFDVFFSGITSDSDDKYFAEAIRKAGNVVLCEYIKHEFIPLPSALSRNGSIYLERVERPAEKLADAAAALAPFPLPKVPTNVSQYWLFKTEAGSKPTLPFVAFQLFSLRTCREFIQLLDSVNAPHATIPPRNADKMIAQKHVGRLIGLIRSSLEGNPAIAQEMLAKLKGPHSIRADPAKIKLLRSLIEAYAGPDSNFLNFYGPPATIQTIPLYRILKRGQDPGNQPDIRGKAVFIGTSSLVPSNEPDSFPTVFTKSDGTDLSGVEIAATAFDNLIENRPIRPAPPAIFLGIVILCGLLLGVMSFVLRPAMAAGGIISFGVLYVLTAQLLFNHAGIWVPIIVPIAVQAPLAFWAGSLWRYASTKSEGRHIRKAFGYFLPDHVINQILIDMKRATGLPMGQQTVYGTVLASDAARYTSLAEEIGPEELKKLMNSYYEVIFRPVRAHSGVISDIIGDSMLAVWARAVPDLACCGQACQAAIDIARAVDDFNKNANAYKLHTRQGIHCGQLVLGHLGGLGHYEYRPVGDVVNTASRIEGLNKHFGTKILISGEVMEGAHGFLARDLGRFLFAGKLKPVRVFELICRHEDADEKQIDSVAVFSEALEALRNRLWDKSAKLFQTYSRIGGNDAASLYYLKKCEIYKQHPPDEIWDGVIRLDEK